MKISLIIPTRERSRYLRESIRTALAVRDPDVEIVISDNASEDDTQAVVAAFDDPRLKYVNTGRRVSMRQNFEFALAASSGDYVSMIGDDDAFLPGQFPFLRRILEERRPDALSWRRPTYGWPIEGFGRRVGGVRFVKSNIFGQAEVINVAELKINVAGAHLRRLVRQPALYHGCVRRSYLESIRTATGAILNGSSPDVYFSFAAIILGGDFVYTDHPFSLNGYSPASIGNAAHAYRAADSRSEPAKRFGREADADPIQDVIPEFIQSIPMVFFSTLETVCTQLGRTGILVDYLAWYSYVLAHAQSADPETGDRVRSVLGGYAERSGTSAAFEQASGLVIAGVPKSPRDAAAGIARAAAKLASFKLSAREGEANTVYTAARLVDTVLADDYGHVLSGNLSSGRAWMRAMRRAAAHRLCGVRHAVASVTDKSANT